MSDRQGEPTAPSRWTVRAMAVAVLLVGAVLLYFAYAGNATELGVRRNGTEVTATVTQLPNAKEPGRISYSTNGVRRECNLVAGRTLAPKGASLRVIADRTNPGACVPAAHDLTDLARTALVLLFGGIAVVGGVWLLRNA